MKEILVIVLALGAAFAVHYLVTDTVSGYGSIRPVWVDPFAYALGVGGVLVGLILVASRRAD